MDNVLDAFSIRAAALFETLPARDTSPTFQLQVASPEDLDTHRRSVEHVEAAEPGPSPMTWSEVVEGSRSLQFDEGRICELSVEARQAFEAEADYDEFDEVAVGSIQVGFEEREREELNKEIVEPEGEASQRRRKSQDRVPRHVKYPHNYICYTLDTPIYVGGGGNNQALLGDRDSEQRLQEDAAMPVVHPTSTEDGSPDRKIAFRSQEKTDVEMKAPLSSLPSRTIATEALRSFDEAEAEAAEETECAKEKDSKNRKAKRNYRKQRPKPSL